MDYDAYDGMDTDDAGPRVTIRKVRSGFKHCEALILLIITLRQMRRQ